MMDDDLPDEVREALKEEAFDAVVERLNGALYIVAVCQRLLQLRSVKTTLGNGGGVTISTLGDAGSKNVASYATVDRFHHMTVSGKLTPPEEALEKLDQIILARGSGGDTTSGG